MPLEQTQSPHAEPTGQIDEGFDADAALSAIEGGGTYEQPTAQAGDPNAATPTTQAQPGAQTGQGAAPATPSATTPAPAQTLTFKGKNDQEVTVPYNDPRAAQWIAQGYSYAQDVHALKQDRAQFDQERSRYEAQYKPIDDYVRANPEFWEHVTSQWQAKQQQAQANGLDPNNPLAQELMALREQFKPVQEFIQTTQQERLTQQQAQEDSTLDQEIQSIRDKFKDLDWATPDQSGRNLELRVLEHAKAIGTKNFDVAFKHLLHDDLVKRTADQAKEAALKDIQSKKKAGLLGTTPAPTRGIQAGETQKHQSWEDAFRGALEDAQAVG